MDLLTRGRAEDLQRALEATDSDREHATELALVNRLRDAGDATALTPTPEFRDALRTRLLAVAAVQGIGETATTAAPARSAVSWRTRATAVTAGVAATVVAASGVAVASSRALPGDPFYGVKRTTEAVQLRVADGPEAEGVRHLQFAETRLREVRALVLGRDAPADAVADDVAPRDVADRVHGALADMDDDTRTGLGLLTTSVRSSRDTAPLAELQRFAVTQGSGLRSVLPALSGPALLRAEQSLVLLEGVRAEADELLLLVDCTAACDPAQTAPGTPDAGAPCGCGPTAVPAPQTAPPPPAPPQGEQPAPGAPEQPAEPSAPDAGPGAVPPAEPQPGPQPSPRPSPPTLLPGVPLPPLPTLPPLLPLPVPLPSLPPLEPLGPDGPSVRLPQPGELLPGLVGAVPALPGPLAGLLQALVPGRD